MTQTVRAIRASFIEAVIAKCDEGIADLTEERAIYQKLLEQAEDLEETGSGRNGFIPVAIDPLGDPRKSDTDDDGGGPRNPKVKGLTERQVQVLLAVGEDDAAVVDGRVIRGLRARGLVDQVGGAWRLTREVRAIVKRLDG